MNSTTTQLVAQVRAAGYQLIQIDQVRTNRWLLVIKDSDDREVLVLAQQRPLLAAADVQDLAELLRLGRASAGFLLAMDGRFSPEAQRTAAELRKPRILLCTALPPAGGSPRVAPLFERAPS